MFMLPNQVYQFQLFYSPGNHLPCCTQIGCNFTMGSFDDGGAFYFRFFFEVIKKSLFQFVEAYMVQSIDQRRIPLVVLLQKEDV